MPPFGAGASSSRLLDFNQWPLRVVDGRRRHVQRSVNPGVARSHHVCDRQRSPAPLKGPLTCTDPGGMDRHHRLTPRAPSQPRDHLAGHPAGLTPVAGCSGGFAFPQHGRTIVALGDRNIPMVRRRARSSIVEASVDRSMDSARRATSEWSVPRHERRARDLLDRDFTAAATNRKWVLGIAPVEARTHHGTSSWKHERHRSA
jgi:hypothetical protein